LPTSAIDAITPAFQHSKQQLFEPFRAGQWAKLALVGFLAGELSSGGGCNFNMPARHNGSEQFLAPGFHATMLPAGSPLLNASLILVLFTLGMLLWVFFIYANSVMRFVLFDSVVARHCEIRRGWSRRQRPGWHYFLWQIVLALGMIMGLVILVGIPLAIAAALGWLTQPKEHLIPLILGGMALFFLALIFLVAWFVVHVLAKDFVVPMMALENVGVIEAWHRLLPMLKSEKGGFAGYLGMKIVMALGAGIVFGIIGFIAIVILLIPFGGLGAVLVLLGKAAGLSWNVYTITVAVVVGFIALMVILYVFSLISVPGIVFFPAYSIYFFAARYAPLSDLLHPKPPAPPETSAIPPPPPAEFGPAL
jgi:hypothetical protein